MGRNDRKKASDVFRDTNYVFSRKVSFKEAFPEIASLSIVVEEDGHGVREWNRVRHYGMNVGEFVDCSNSLCYNGGFSIGEILREMVRKKETHKEETAICKGYEGSPKGRRKYRNCINSFDITVDITYKEESETED